MPITFQCPDCGKKLKAPDTAAGKSSTCPGCGANVTCPDPVYDAEVVEMGPPAEPPGFNPFADLDDDKPYGVAKPTPSQESSTEERRPCPMCGEMILTTAAKCRFCGEVFDPTLKKAKKKKKSKKHAPEDEELAGSEIVFGLLCSGLACIFGLVWLIQGKPKGLNTVDASPGGRLVRSLDRGLLCSLDRDRRDGLRPPEARRHRQGRAKLSGHGPFRDGQLLLIFNTDGFVRPFLRSLAVKHGMGMLPVRQHGRAGRATKRWCTSWTLRVRDR
jgi:predicted RNA-binding Zn-ribbon protein involved in translation (DUF1610 family)